VIATHPELVIWAALVVLYVSDLVTLLHYNEVLLRDAGGDLSARVSRSRVEIRNRRLAVLNPFTPHALLFRIRWGIRAWEQTPVDTDLNRIQSSAEALQQPTGLCLLLAVTLLLGFPALSLTAGFAVAFLATAVFGYALIIAAAALVTARRRELDIAAQELVPLLAVSLLCLPCGINLCRRASMLVPVESDAARILPHLLPGAEFERAATAIVARASEEIEIGLEEATEQRLRRYIETAFPR